MSKNTNKANSTVVMDGFPILKSLYSTKPAPVSPILISSEQKKSSRSLNNGTTITAGTQGSVRGKNPK